MKWVLVWIGLLGMAAGSTHAAGPGDRCRISGFMTGMDGTYVAGNAPDDLIAATRHAQLSHLLTEKGQQLLKPPFTINGAEGVTLEEVNKELAPLKPKVADLWAKGSLRLIAYNTAVKIIDNGKSYSFRLFGLRPEGATGRASDLKLCKVEVLDGPMKGAVVYVPADHLSDWERIEGRDQVYLYHEGADSTVFAATDPKQLEQFFETLKVKNDHAAAEALVKSGKVVILECNTRAQVIREDQPIARVRILAGEHKGNEYYVLFPFLKLLPQK
jgi:hypothetical protein